MEFSVVPVPPSLSTEVRRTRKSPGYGYPVHRETASGYGPCRSCLAPFREGAEARILFTYDPFMPVGDLPLPGPIFIHEHGCRPYRPDGGYPESLRFLGVTLNAYGRGRQLKGVRHVETYGAAEQAIEDLLSNPLVDYIQVRNTEAGCFVFRVERQSGGSDRSSLGAM